MHMPPGGVPEFILPCGGGELGPWLWRALAPEHWPLPVADLPAGTALVGGAVRDGLLQRLPPKPDLDLVVPGDAVALAAGLRRRLGGSCVVLDRDRSIARLVLRGWTIDLARREGRDLAEDLGRRDYTVNAIALPLQPAGGDAGLVDPHGGLPDLSAGRLAAVSEANLLADPLRLLRGLRLAAELGFRLEPRTWEWILRHRGRLAAVAGERALAELERMAAADDGEGALLQVDEAGLLRPWSGPADRRGLGRCSRAQGRALGFGATEEAAALPLARLACLLDETGLTRLPTSRRLRQRCRRLRHWWGRLAELPRPRLAELEERERLRLQRDLEEDLPALLPLLEPEEAREALARWRNPADPLFHPRPPIDGVRLQRELGLAPGPQLGALLEHLMGERAFGRLPDEQTLTQARRWLARCAGPRHD
jgi:tRNA nucleotidyltransferase (CCA-adding enzyme)